MNDDDDIVKPTVEALQPMVAKTAELVKRCKDLPRIMSHPGGRELITKILADTQAYANPLRQCNRDLDKSIQAMQKALRKRSWGVPL